MQIYRIRLNRVYFIIPIWKKLGGNPLDGAKLEEAIWQDPNFKTVYGGTMKLNKDGSVVKPLVVFKVEGGELKVHKKISGE